jgi:hypothetical protein
MTPKSRIIDGKNRIRGEGGSKVTKKNRTSFMYDPLPIIFLRDKITFFYLIKNCFPVPLKKLVGDQNNR